MMIGLRKVFNRQFCLWVVPSGNGAVRKVRFRLSTILLVASLSMLTAGVLGYIASDYSRVQVARLVEGYQHSSLQAEHSLLQRQSEQLSEEVSRLESLRGQLENSQKAVKERVLELHTLLEGIGASGLFEEGAMPSIDDLSGLGGVEGDEGEGIGGAEVEIDVPLSDAASQVTQDLLADYKSLHPSTHLVHELDDMITLLRNVPLGYPGNGHVNSNFGPRFSPFSRRMSQHQGVDLALPMGSFVHATADGVVESVKRTRSYGLVVDVRHSPKVLTRYAHLSRTVVREGETICRGEYVGLVGSTGRSTGPHLHYEVRVNKKAIDPRPLMSLPDRVSFNPRGL